MHLFLLHPASKYQNFSFILFIIIHYVLGLELCSTAKSVKSRGATGLEAYVDKNDKRARLVYSYLNCLLLC
jgi:hypothetical protein